MTNKQILNKILQTLEKEHINLYHDVSKEEVLKHIESIDGLNEMSDCQFDLEMLKLFALFKDAHTWYEIPFLLVDKPLIYIHEKYYVLNNNKWEEVSCFGRLKASEMYNKLEPLIGYETKEWLNHKIKRNINNTYTYNLLGLNDGDKIKLTLKDGTNLDLHQQKVLNNKFYQQKAPYSYKLLDDDILYVKYESCWEDNKYPFVEFAKDVAKVVEDKKINDYILDLRGNTGGNSEILNPFQDLVKDKKLRGVLLIDNGVFSSGRFAVARFKKEFNTTLIGEPTGGAAKAYGYLKRLEVEGKKFSASIRLWDFSDIFGYEGAIQPDILVENCIENIQNHKDMALKTAVDYINKTKNKNNDTELEY